MKRRRRAPAAPRTRPSRINQGKIIGNLRIAAKKGDPSALSLALGEMRTLALTPRYWEKYLTLLRNPLARLADLLVIKQGERIAHQKGWKKLGGGPRPPSEASPGEGCAGKARARSGDLHPAAAPRRPNRPRSSSSQHPAIV